jgi:hypothetical protein
MGQQQNKLPTIDLGSGMNWYKCRKHGINCIALLSEKMISKFPLVPTEWQVRRDMSIAKRVCAFAKSYTPVLFVKGFV